jgi:hypothetical protein
MEDLENIEILSAKGDIEEFKESLIWKDIVRELSAWKAGFEMEMMGITNRVADENPSTANVLMHIGDITGRIRAVDYMLSLPDVLIGLVEMKKEDKEEE